MLKAIKAQLGVSFKTMAELAGPAAATLHGWAETTVAEQIEALVRLLSHLPEPTRHQVLDSVCPICPSLAHPFIARDRLVCDHLRSLVDKRHGVTLVLSESDYLRTFVATALAHTKTTRQPNRLLVSGFDIHEPTWFSGVRGVVYLSSARKLDTLSRTFAGHQVGSTEMILINGLYNRLAEIRKVLHETSSKSHLVIAEQTFAELELKLFSRPHHLVLVSPGPRAKSPSDDAAEMSISVRELSQRPAP